MTSKTSTKQATVAYDIARPNGIGRIADTEVLLYVGTLSKYGAPKVSVTEDFNEKYRVYWLRFSQTTPELESHLKSNGWNYSGTKRMAYPRRVDAQSVKFILDLTGIKTMPSQAILIAPATPEATPKAPAPAPAPAPEATPTPKGIKGKVAGVTDNTPKAPAPATPEATPEAPKAPASGKGKVQIRREGASVWVTLEELTLGELIAKIDSYHNSLGAAIAELHARHVATK